MKIHATVHLFSWQQRQNTVAFFFFLNESTLSDYSHKLQRTPLELTQMQRHEHMLQEKAIRKYRS